MMLGPHDSPRWCAICQGYGDHHTDRCLNQDTAIGLPETWTIPVQPSRSDRVFVWAGWRGFGFRLWIVEMQVYFYPPNE